MKIHRLTVRNFKCFADSTIEFSPEFNAIVGDNGAGKSALLDALSIGVGAFLLGIDKEPSRNIRKDDVRLIRSVVGDVATVERQYPVRVEVQGDVHGRSLTWHRTMSGDERGTSRKTARNIKDLAAELQSGVREQDNTTLPLIAYYGTGRMWRQITDEAIIIRIRGMSEATDDTVGPVSRLDGYDKCLSAETNQSFLTRWLKTQELAAVQQQRQNPTLEGIKQAVGQCMTTWTKLRYDISTNEIIGVDDKQNSMPIRLLSDGQRNVLFTALDIAYRASILNPHLRSEACAQTPGVVLIDEIDLHLHPKWQRRVVDDLRSAFPSIQFIVSTHSPHVIQSLHDGELIDIGNHQIGEYVGRSPEDILESVMDVEVPQRSERSLAMIQAAEEYYSVLRDAGNSPSPKRTTEIQRRLDELSEPYSDNEAFIAFLRQERIAAGL